MEFPYDEQDSMNEYLTRSVGYWYSIEDNNSTIEGDSRDILPRYRNVYNDDEKIVGIVIDWYQNTVPVEEMGITVELY